MIEYSNPSCLFLPDPFLSVLSLNGTGWGCETWKQCSFTNVYNLIPGQKCVRFQISDLKLHKNGNIYSVRVHNASVFVTHHQEESIRSSYYTLELQTSPLNCYHGDEVMGTRHDAQIVLCLYVCVTGCMYVCVISFRTFEQYLHSICHFVTALVAKREMILEIILHSFHLNICAKIVMTEDLCNLKVILFFPVASIPSTVNGGTSQITCWLINNAAASHCICVIFW